VRRPFVVGVEANRIRVRTAQRPPDDGHSHLSNPRVCANSGVLPGQDAQERGRAGSSTSPGPGRPKRSWGSTRVFYGGDRHAIGATLVP